jgi:hypothetical protein
VLSEIGYYLDPTDWLQVIEQSVASLAHDGGLLACHWRHPIAGCPQDGREVHALLARHLPLYRCCATRRRTSCSNTGRVSPAS